MIRPETPVPDVQLTVGGALRAELLKLRALPATWRLSGLALILMVVVAAATMAGYGDSVEAQRTQVTSASVVASDQEFLVQAFESGTVGMFLAAILLGCLGTLAVTSEFTSGSIRSTATAVPRRGLLVAAKLAAVGLWCAGAAVVILAATLAVVLPVVAGGGLLGSLEPGLLVRVVLTHVAAFVVVGLLGAGLGLLLRSTVGALLGLVFLLFVVGLALQILGGVGDRAWIPDVVFAWEVGNLLTSLTSPRAPSATSYQTMPGIGPSLLGLAAWLAAVIVPAMLLFRRRDV